MQKKMLLDATKTFESQFTTGIQRVVRELARRADLIGNALGLDVVLVVASGRKYYRLDATGRERLFALPLHNSANVVAQSKLSRGAKNLLQSNMRVYAMLQRWSMRRHMTKLTQGLEEIAARSGDIVASIDEFSGGSSSIEALSVARRHGAITMAIIYDLIPLLHQDMVSVPVAYLFRHAFERLSCDVDGLIAISRSGADLIRMQSSVLRADISVTSFYLGQDLRVTSNEKVLATIPSEAWQRGPTFLMVGTIEPRKRHAVTLAAFDRLWKEGRAANLVIIGRIGWEVDELVQSVLDHPQYGRSLFLCHQVGDAELRIAMAKASAVIMASKAEGFGLPIVEALAFGISIIATDIPIFREIAGDAGRYFPPDDVGGLTAVIKQFIANPKQSIEAARRFKWIDWDESALEFAAAVRTIVDRKASHEHHMPA